ncbi:S8 family peptidase, partial [Streptomyces sp. SID8455]|nr:S8 family peptidase [Streptomyces sp. SID8455]
MSVMRHTPHARRRLAAATVIATAAAVALATAGTLPATAAERAPEGVILNAGAPGTVSDSYIVTLKDSAARSDSAQGKALAKKYGASIERTYRSALNGYAVEATAAEAKKFAADPAVASVSQNRTF